ncbi:hypothetical protein L873DRAFT_1790489 [Choiromyces venosus 120613-1]|uniref:SH3 domain-containing protein n=1 Tax=Choiromyces venosus 120613-1 TaxID=1336337 RepID=A0A3N4JIR6_9PEZI|nr:hypothetical protein L873DRAFT_1790489 [Choiromyces venosus 120613-1]
MFGGSDTLDLQPCDRASAQDHSNAPNSPRNTAGFAPSQSQAIRNVSTEQAQTKQDSEKPDDLQDSDVDEVERDLAGSEEMAGDDGSFDDDDTTDRMSSSPSIADGYGLMDGFLWMIEDIDFEMVYALHNFTATVKGQANATKGEHMVLLDDSNSYWWLVRIVRDTSIGKMPTKCIAIIIPTYAGVCLGYLPAEYIETPTERLARLNKHRNIDLASNMLSDNAHEKSKNPLRKAMRRRNAKAVTFSPPTYVEASEYEYSTDEEEGEHNYYAEDEGQDQERDSNDIERVDSGGKCGEERSRSGSDPKSDTSREDGDVKVRKNPAPAALRHPDSAVFSDDKAETKKLTLTPNLLRDDATTSVDHVRGQSSIEKLSKRDDGITSPQPGGKDSRKAKKGGSVLGNLFKKRNKKGRKDDEDDLEEWLHSSDKADKQNASISSRESEDSQLESVKKDKEEFHRREEQRRQQKQQQQREGSQKPTVNTGTSSTIRRVGSDDSPRSGDRENKDDVQVHGPTAQQKKSIELQRNDSATKPVAVYAPSGQKGSTLSERRSGETDRGPPTGEKLVVLHSPVEPKTSDTTAHKEVVRKPSKDNIKPAYAQYTYQPAPQPSNSSSIGNGAGTSTSNNAHQFPERLSESPEHISYHDAISDRPDMLDLSSSSENTTPIHSSPEIIDRSNTLESSSPESHPMTRTWSDWSLRTYFEDDNDVRDMLIVVQQDKSNSPATRKEHPDIGPLFEDASSKLADITKRLDGMLGDWLQRKGRARP